MRFAHLAFDLGAWHERRDRVDDDNVHSARSNQDFHNLQRLLSVVGLRDEQVVEFHAELGGILRVEGMLGIHERRHPSEFLRFGDHLERQRRLARRLRPEDLDDATARHTTNPEGVVEADRSGRDGRHRRDDVFLAEAHDRAFAELFLDLADGQLDGFEAFAVLTVVYRRHSRSFED